jgi:lycopene beta-cyclase
VKSLDTHTSYVRVTTPLGDYHGKRVFNSIPQLAPQNSHKNAFWQCFVGYEIETKQEIFDPQICKVMEFQDEGKQIGFVYTLPTSSNNALVEYTFFAREHMKYQDIENKLELYLEKLGSYSIKQKEYGTIPQQTHQPRRYQQIIDIGTA